MTEGPKIAFSRMVTSDQIIKHRKIIGRMKREDGWIIADIRQKK